MKETAQNSPYGIRLLLALQSKLIYQGTVDPKVVERRRAAGRRAKAARKVNRGH